MEELLQKESGGPLAEDQSGTGEIVVYQPDDITRLEVRVEGESVWLTQAQMSDLFQKDQSVIARHIKNVFREAELEQASNMQILHNTLSKFKPVTVYSLDVIISVGYRVKSLRGTQFRGRAPEWWNGRWNTIIWIWFFQLGIVLNLKIDRLSNVCQPVTLPDVPQKP